MAPPPPHPSTSASRHLGLVAAVTFAGASNPVAIKAAIGLGFPPFLLGFGRTLCVGLVFAAWAAWGAGKGGPVFGAPGVQRQWVLLASLAKAVSVACSFAALALIPASRVAMLSAFSPLASLLLVRLLLKHERITRSMLAGTSLGLAALVVLVAFQRGAEAASAAAGAENAALLGDLVTIVGILCVQAMIVFEKKALDAGMSAQQLATAASAVGVATLAAAALGFGERLQSVPLCAPAAALFLYLVAVPGVFHFYAKRWLTAVLDVSFLAAFQNAERALAIALSMALLGERVSLTSLVCFGIILAGTVVATRDSGGAESRVRR